MTSVTMDRLLAATRDLWPADFRRSRPRTYRGPARREPHLGPLAPPEVVEEIMRLASLAGNEWLNQWVLSTLGPAGVPRSYSEATPRRRAERARIMEAAWEDLLAGQYPNVRVRVRWGAVQNGVLTAGVNPNTAPTAGPRYRGGLLTQWRDGGWKVLLRFEVRQ